MILKNRSIILNNLRTARWATKGSNSQSWSKKKIQTQLKFLLLVYPNSSSSSLSSASLVRFTTDSNNGTSTVCKKTNHQSKQALDHSSLTNRALAPQCHRFVPDMFVRLQGRLHHRNGPTLYHSPSLSAGTGKEREDNKTQSSVLIPS